MRKIIITILLIISVILFTGCRLKQTVSPQPTQSETNRQTKDTWPPTHVVKLPNSETWALDNELVILASGQDIELLVKKFGGKITSSVPETDSYQVKFPTSSLEELNAIADKLRKQVSGIQVTNAFVMKPPKPGEPQ